MNPEYEDFARRLVEFVRDRAVASCDSRLLDVARSPAAQRWRQASGDAAESAIAVAIPDIVDDVLFHLLDAIDSGDLPLAFQAAGRSVDLTASGELAGFYMMTGGWRTTSTERYYDDFAE